MVLLDPDSNAVAAHAEQSHAKESDQPEEVIRMHIHSTIAALNPFLNPKKAAPGSIEVRFSLMFAPYSMFAVDLEKDTGVIVVEFHIYRTDLDTRPHVVLDRRHQAYWFDFYRDQFRRIWEDSRPISEQAES